MLYLPKKSLQNQCSITYVCTYFKLGLENTIGLRDIFVVIIRKPNPITNRFIYNGFRKLFVHSLLIENSLEVGVSVT